MGKHVVAEVNEIENGDRVVTELEGREIGVFKIDGEYHAYTSWCAHQSGPICEGIVGGTVEATFDRETREVERQWTREGQLIRCPWHDWEYDLESGECLSKPGIRLPEHDVTIEDGQIIVSI